MKRSAPAPHLFKLFQFQESSIQDFPQKQTCCVDVCCWWFNRFDVFSFNPCFWYLNAIPGDIVPIVACRFQSSTKSQVIFSAFEASMIFHVSKPLRLMSQVFEHLPLCFKFLKRPLPFDGQVFRCVRKASRTHVRPVVALKKWSFVCVKFQAFHHPATWTLKKARRACMFHGKNNRKVTGMMDSSTHWRIS